MKKITEERFKQITRDKEALNNYKKACHEWQSANIIKEHKIKYYENILRDNNLEKFILD